MAAQSPAGLIPLSARADHEDAMANRLLCSPGAGSSGAGGSGAPAAGVLLAYASETGFIDEVAEITRSDLEAAGISVRLIELGELDIRALRRTKLVLFMTSTTGNGDAPFAADPFADEVMARHAQLSHLRFGLLCAGDLSYEDFCGFGHRLRDWLLASGACPLFETIDVDREDDQTVEHWRCCVARAFSRPATRLV